VTYALHVAKVVVGIVVAAFVALYGFAGAVRVELLLPAVTALLAGL
jgi:hypothetical protein